MISRILYIEVIKWYKRLSLLFLLWTITGYFLDSAKGIADVFFWNFSYHAFFWFFYKVPILIIREINNQKFNVFGYKFFAIFLFLTALLACGSGALNFIVFDFYFAVYWPLFATSIFLTAIHLYAKSVEH